MSVHLLGDGLTSGAVERLSAACRDLADASLCHHDMTDMLAGVQLRGGYSRAVMGRMFLPQLAEGRVLYIDSDTLTCADISPLFEMDMGTAKVAAVRDYTVLGTFRKGKSYGVTRAGTGEFPDLRARHRRNSTHIDSQSRHDGANSHDRIRS